MVIAWRAERIAAPDKENRMFSWDVGKRHYTITPHLLNIKDDSLKAPANCLMSTGINYTEQ